MQQSPTSRIFSTAFKLEVIERIEAGAAMASLARELGIKRKLLYDWHGSWRASGVDGLNRKRGPKPGSKRKVTSASVPEGRVTDPHVTDLSQARSRIAELERIIGRQQSDLDFFREALRALDETAPQGNGPSGSTRSSKP
jgi:transposase